MAQEEYNAIVAENQIAQDNLAKIDNDLARYTEAARVYANATPAQQEQLKGTMAQLIQQYGELKAQREAAASRVVNATNQLEGANALMAQQPVQQQVVNGGGQKRRVVTNNIEPVSQSHGNPIVITGGVPQNIDKIMAVNNGVQGGNISQGTLVTPLQQYNNTINNAKQAALDNARKGNYIANSPLKAWGNYRRNGNVLDNTSSLTNPVKQQIGNWASNKTRQILGLR